MSHKATDWAWEMPVKGVRKLVLLALAERANVKTCQCNPSLPELAARTGIAESSVRDHVRALEAVGLVRVKVTNGGRRQRSTYTLPVGRSASECANTHREPVGIEVDETHRDSADETHREPVPTKPKTHREPETNPPGAGAVGLRPKTGTREPGTTRRAADAPPTGDGGLFETPQSNPSTEVANIKDRAPEMNGGTAVAAWCDGYRESFPDCQPTAEQTGRVGRSAKQLLKVKNPQDKVVYAAWSAGTKGLLDVQREYQFLSSRSRGAKPADTRTPVTETRVNGALALAEMFDQREQR